MPLGLVAYIAIEIGLNILARLLAPGKQRPKPQPFESPISSSGTPCGRGFGVYEVQPIVGMVAETYPPDQEEIEEGDNKGQIVTYYYVKMQLVLGWGPIHVLYDIVSDERSIRTQIPGDKQSIDGNDPNIIYPPLPLEFGSDHQKIFSINARQMFGGNSESGGLQGILEFNTGSESPAYNALVQEKHGEFASTYPWTAYVMLGAEAGYPEGLSTSLLNQQGEKFYIRCNSPTPAPMSFVVGYYPDALLTDGGRIGVGGNAVEFLYDLLKDVKWGGKWQDARLDVVQIRSKAIRIRNERLALSIPQDNPQPLEQTVDDILTHIDGGLVQDPTTGLIQLKLARDDYDPDALLVINKSNTENFKRGKPLAPKSLNDIQVRYRRFVGGVAGEVTDEVVTFDADLNSMLPAYGLMFAYKLAGDTVEAGSVHVFADDGVTGPVELTESTDINAMNPGDWFLIYDRGTLWIRPGIGIVEEGARITVSYVSNPSFTAFVDDVALAQNIALQQSTGQHQPESFDYTFYIDNFSAQWKADRLRSTMSRSLDTFAWEGKRDQSYLTPWDVVRLTEPEWGLDVIVRITKVDYGTRENPQLSIEGVKDIWGEKYLLTAPGGGGGGGSNKPTASVPHIACGSGGDDISRIVIFPTDSLYGVEVYEATDDTGTGSTLVATIAAGTDPMYYDGDPTKWYAARQVASFSNPSALTAWLQCAEGPIIIPECTLPVATFAADDGSGLLVLSINDPQDRVQEVRYRILPTDGISSADWIVATAPYEWTVPLDVSLETTIEWEIDFLNCATETETGTGSYTFPSTGTTEPPPEDELPPIPVEIAVHTSPVEGLALEAFPSVATSIDGTELGEKFPLFNCRYARLVYKVKSIDETMPEGAYLALRYAIPVSAEDPDAPPLWDYLDGINGPYLSVDPAQFGDDSLLGHFPKTIAGPWAAIVPEAQDDVLLDVVGVGGDDVSEALLHRLVIQLTAQGQVTPPEIIPPEPPVDPDCLSASVVDPFSFANVAALEAAWPEDNSDPTNAVWSVPSGKVRLSLSGTGTGHAWRSKVLTGTPNAQFTYYLLIHTNQVDVQAFIEHVGGERAIASTTSTEDLHVTGNYDGSGNATIRYGVLDIGQSAAILESDDLLDVAGTGWTAFDDFGAGTWTGQDGANGIEAEVHPTIDWESGNLAQYKEFTLTPGDIVRAECEIRINPISLHWWDTQTVVRLYAGHWAGNPAVGSSGSVTKDNAFHVAHSGYITVPVDGVVTAILHRGTAMADHGVDSTGSFWWRNFSIRSQAGGAAVIDFDDLAYCPGIGTGPGGNRNGPPEGPGPGPGEPPGEIIPPVTPHVGARDFGIYNIPASGAGPWNSTIKILKTLDGLQSTYNQAHTAGNHLYVQFGNYGAGSEPFSWTLWKHYVDLLKDSSYLASAIADGTFGLHLLLDEPNRTDRYPPSGVSINLIEDMAEYSKSIWPTWPTLLRISPFDKWFTRHINGLDYTWGEYLLARGPIDDYMAKTEDAMVRWNHGVIYGLHYGAFDRASTYRVPTAAEIDLYGGKLASQNYAYAMAGWRYYEPLMTPDRMAALNRVAAIQAAHDP